MDLYVIFYIVSDLYICTHTPIDTKIFSMSIKQESYILFFFNQHSDVRIFFAVSSTKKRENVIKEHFLEKFW